MEEVDNFDKLKAVVEDMTRHKDDLEIEGVFASTSFGSGEDWRWQTHLANVPVYFAFHDKNISDTDTLDFTYAENYKNIFDLYIGNSCTIPTTLSKKISIRFYGRVCVRKSRNGTKRQLGMESNCKCRR